MSDLVELMRTDSGPFEEVCRRGNATRLRIWACNVRDFTPLANLKRLKHLEVLDFSRGSLAILGELAELESVRIILPPKDERDLAPLAKLRHLEDLSLESPASWDASGKVLVFQDLWPLAELHELRVLTLMKARVEQDGLRPLWHLNRLRELRTDNTFSTEDFALLAGHLPQAAGDFLHPYHEVNYSTCRKCGNKKLRLSGVARGGLICPTCNSARLEAHTTAFEKIRSGAQPAS